MKLSIKLINVLFLLLFNSTFSLAQNNYSDEKKLLLTCIEALSATTSLNGNGADE